MIQFIINTLPLSVIPVIILIGLMVDKKSTINRNKELLGALIAAVGMLILVYFGIF